LLQGIVTMRSLLVFAALAVIALADSAAVSLGFVGGENLTNAEADFSFRFSSVNTVDLYFAQLLAWSSVSVDLATANESAKAAADVMLGIGGMPTSVNVPFAFLAYGSGEGAVDLSLTSFLSNLFAPISAKIDSNFAGGVVAMAALGMQEYDPDDKAVGKYVSFAHGCSSSDELSGDSGNLKGLSCVLSPSGTSAKVTVTYVTSKKAGILEYGHTPVSPRSYEMVIEVKDFPLTDDKNHVRLDVALITASGAGDIEGNANVVHREGKEDIYAVASEYAVIDGKRKEIDLKVESAAYDLGLSAEALLKVALSGTIDVRVAQVNFPAGAKNFVYDPAVGAGCNVYEAGASTVALSLLIAVLCALALLF